MFIGHIAVGLGAKRIAPEVSTGTLMLAACLADVLALPLMLAGLEHASIRPGITAVNSLDLYDIPISHSLLMGAVWAALLASAWFLRRRSARGAWVIAAAVLSHWVLDFVSHRPDMPLAPGVRSYLGLGLWNSPAATFLVEGALWAAGLVLYLSATKPRGRAGVYGFWSIVGVLTLLWMVSLRGEVPPNLRAVEVVNLVLFAGVLAWAYWMNRARTGTPAATAATQS